MSRRAHNRCIPPPSYKPWPCVTLDVDPGASCGVSIFQRGVYVDSGHGDGFDVRWMEFWLDNAVFYAGVLELPLVLVLEKPPRGGHGYKVRKPDGSYQQRSPLGAASVIGCRKLWLRAWRHAPVLKRGTVHPYPQTWRAPLFGTAIRTQQRERVLACRTKYGRGRELESINADEAVSIGLGTWAACAGQVGAAMPRPRGRHG